MEKFRQLKCQTCGLVGLVQAVNKQTRLLTDDLCYEHAVTEAPDSGDDEEHVEILSRRHPEIENNQKRKVETQRCKTDNITGHCTLPLSMTTTTTTTGQL